MIPHTSRLPNVRKGLFDKDLARYYFMVTKEFGSLEGPKLNGSIATRSQNKRQVPPRILWNRELFEKYFKPYIPTRDASISFDRLEAAGLIKKMAMSGPHKDSYLLRNPKRLDPDLRVKSEQIGLNVKRKWDEEEKDRNNRHALFLAAAARKAEENRPSLKKKFKKFGAFLKRLMPSNAESAK